MTTYTEEEMRAAEEALSKLPPEARAIILGRNQELLNEHKQKARINAIAEVYDIAKKNNFRISTNIDEKYDNPKAWDKTTGQTWAGSGGQPKWLIAAIKAGKSLEDFKVD